MLLPPPLGTLGTLGNNVFRGNGLHLLDLSVTKKWRITERVSAQFRVESFNILNVTAYSNPAYNQGPTGQHNNPTSTGGFGNSTTTPDVQIANPPGGRRRRAIHAIGPEADLLIRVTFGPQDRIDAELLPGKFGHAARG